MNFRKILTDNTKSKIRLLVLVGFLISYVPFLIEHGLKYQDIPSIDLPSFYTASVSAFIERTSPYDAGHLQQDFGSPDPVYPYLYPPPSLLLFFPLVYFSYSTVVLITLILNHVLFLTLAWIIPVHLMKWKLDEKPAHFILWFFYCFTFFPAISTINHGQFNFLLVMFLTLYLLYARKGSSVWAALFLSLAILLKSYPVVILPLLLLLKRKKDVMYTLSWMAIFTVAAFVLLPLPVWRQWIFEVLPTGGYASIPDGLFTPAVIWNQGLNGVFSRIFLIRDWTDPASPAVFHAKMWTSITAIIILLATSVYSWKGRALTDQPLRTVIAALPAIFLIAPFSWEHHLVYLLPSILFIFDQGNTIPKRWALVFYMMFLACAVILSVEYFVTFKFYGVVSLWILILFVGNRTRNENGG